MLWTTEITQMFCLLKNDGGAIMLIWVFFKFETPNLGVSKPNNRESKCVEMPGWCYFAL